MDKTYVVNLTPKERPRLLAVVNKGQNKAAVIRRAPSLLKSDEGKCDREIGELLYIHEESVRNTRQRFVEDGLQAALEDKAKPKPEPKLNEQQQAHLVAVACRQPPAGQARWTLELLAAQLVKDGIVAGISPEAVRLALKKTTGSRGRSKVGVFPRSRPSSCVGWSTSWRCTPDPMTRCSRSFASMRKAINCWRIAA